MAPMCFHVTDIKHYVFQLTEAAAKLVLEPHQSLYMYKYVNRNSHQEFSRCRTRGEYEGTYITYASTKCEKDWPFWH